MLRLYLRRDQLREVLSSGDNGADRGANAARQLASAVSRGDLSALDELSLAVSTYVFQSDTADLAELEEYLVLEMGKVTRYYESLPLVQDKKILDNILYSGIWLEYRRRKKLDRSL